VSWFPFAILAVLILAREYTFHQERVEWLSERRELTNRVQAPDRLPSVQTADFVLPEVELDEFNLVGVISEPSDD
jgi:hypothetical protein